MFTENYKAKNVNEWYDYCIEKGLEDIKLLMPISVKDPSLLAFSNASQAGLICYFKDNLVTYFIPKWEHKDNGWNTIYREYKLSLIHIFLKIYINKTYLFFFLLLTLFCLLYTIMVYVNLLRGR